MDSFTAQADSANNEPADKPRPKQTETSPSKKSSSDSTATFINAVLSSADAIAKLAAYSKVR
jgi:hypothetical protein